MNWIGLILNSNFISSLLGACAGAFAGAWAAWRISERGKRRDELLQELRSVNVGIRLALSVFNTFVALKGQHVKRLRDVYDEQQKKFAAERARDEEGRRVPGEIVKFDLDFETFGPVAVDAGALKSVAFEKVSLSGNSALVASALAQSVDAANGAMITRNQLVEEFRKLGPHTLKQKLEFYFSVTDEHGNTDKRYAASIEAIYFHVDGCLFFSNLLSDRLIQRGEQLKAEFAREFRTKTPPVVKANLDRVKKELMPNPADFPDWADQK